MNAKERFLNTLNRKPVDRPSVAAVATGITVGMMEKRGIFWPEAHKDPDLLAGLAESIYLYTDIDNIKLPFDMAVEVEALGAEINYRTIDTLPTEVRHIYDHPDQLVIPKDFLDRGRVPVALKAISKLHKRYKDEAPIVALTDEPFTIAAKLFGFNNFLMWIITNPEWVHQIMAKLTPLAIKYATAEVEAGADAIILGGATCSRDLISSETYRDFIMPYHKQLCPAIPAPTILHICGKSTGHLPYIVQTGTTCYNFDEGVDIKEAVKILKGKVLISGYVPAVSVMLQGTPEEVYRSSIECLDNGVELLTPGCALPAHTPLENIAAMTQAAKDWGREHAEIFS
ncbi:MAG TPA: MtaA/CmuA family methyltransferase [Anaerolineae bacterium]|nr:MtaA/CmuA family methyltransferase [Anaerolineae bacterium]